MRTGVGATASAVPPTPSYSPDPLLLRILPLGRGSEDRVSGEGGEVVRPPASALPTHPLRPQPFPSQHPPVLGFLGPDTTEVIIQLLSIQWNSHKVTSGVKRNKIENKIHPDC